MKPLHDQLGLMGKPDSRKFTCEVAGDAPQTPSLSPYQQAKS